MSTEENNDLTEREKELTEREKEVIKSYDIPKCAALIADDLGMSLDTFYTHQKNILKKTGLPAMTHVVAHFKKDWII
jgi:DNA-binding CsgD family transcriptional regulator